VDECNPCFMADLMEVFRKLLAGGALTSDQKAHTLLTACDILSGHGEALHVDTGEFHRQLYAMLGQPSMGGGSGQGGGWTAAMAAADDTAGEGGSDRGTLRIRTLQRFLAGYKQAGAYTRPLSAQPERFVWDRGCAEGLCSPC